MHDHITGKTTFSKVIEIVVSPQGDTRVETSGFAGAECRAASKFLEDALGERASETLTAEYHHTVQQRTETQQLP